jgi:succinate-semialdehyde dehydrogenase / glutarate-semialdehyde dehydrogenase
MITRKAAPGLAVGCTVVCKAAAETPLTALAYAELAHRAGFPKGVFNVITASPEGTPAIGGVLTSHPTVKKVSFTGSTAVGKLLMQQSASTMKKLSLELGGNSPFIVFDDADLDAAVAGALSCKFRGTGQVCVSANRILVQRGVHDDFAERLTAAVRAQFKIGNGFDKATTHGPLIHDRAVARVQSLVDDARSKGASVSGGQKLDTSGSFFAPTVVVGATRDMDIASQEIFGPVAAIFPFDTEAEVVDIANSVSVGLAGYIYSQNIHRIQRVAEALEVGMVGANAPVVSDPAAPFGGVKQSGYGLEGSKYGINEYLVTKTITYGGMGEPLQGRPFKI